MKTAAIVVGHGPRIDKGAVNDDGTTELDWNKDLGVRIYEALKCDCQIKPVLIYRRVEKVSPTYAVNEVDSDVAIELHLNSHHEEYVVGYDSDGNPIMGIRPSSASGTEMIHYPGSSKGARLAGTLLVAAVDVLQLPNRGVKTPWAGRGMGFLRGTRCPAVIVESFFISNNADLARGNSVKQRLAEAYADALVKYLA